MIISLRSLVAEIVDRGHDEITCISHLIEAHRTGRHFVFANRPLLMAIAASSQYSAPVRGMANRLIMSFNPQCGPLLKRAGAIIEVIDGTSCGSTAGQPQPSGSANGTKLIHFDLREFLHGVFTPVLIGENLSDTSLWESLSRLVVGSERGIHLHCRRVNGGGSTTYTVVEQEERERNPGVVIYDSDKKWESDRPGTTAGKINAELQKCSIITGIVTDSREMENEVGFGVIEWYYRVKSDSHKLGEATSIRSLMSHVGVELLRWVELKSGFSIMTSGSGTIDYSEGGVIRQLPSRPGICTYLSLCASGHCNISFSGVGSSFLDGLTEEVQKIIVRSQWHEAPNIPESLEKKLKLSVGFFMAPDASRC